MPWEVVPQQTTVSYTGNWGRDSINLAPAHTNVSPMLKVGLQFLSDAFWKTSLSVLNFHTNKQPGMQPEVEFIFQVGVAHWEHAPLCWGWLSGINPINLERHCCCVGVTVARSSLVSNVAGAVSFVT